MEQNCDVTLNSAKNETQPNTNLLRYATTFYYFVVRYGVSVSPSLSDPPHDETLSAEDIANATTERRPPCIPRRIPLKLDNSNLQPITTHSFELVQAAYWPLFIYTTKQVKLCNIKTMRFNLFVLSLLTDTVILTQEWSASAFAPSLVRPPPTLSTCRPMGILYPRNVDTSLFTSTDDQVLDANDVELLQKVFDQYSDKDGLMTKADVMRVPAISQLLVSILQLENRHYFSKCSFR